MKHLRKHFLSFCLLTFHFALVGQNPTWTLPPSSITQNQPPLPLPTDPLADPAFAYTGEPSSHVHNAIASQNGEIEFFIVDQNIYNGLGHLVGELYSNTFQFAIKGYTESLIVPVPNQCDRYYIIQAGRGVSWSNSNYLPHYAILDMSLPSGWNDPASFGQLIDLNGAPVNGQFSCYNLEEGVDDFFPISFQNQPCMMAVSDENPDQSRFLFVSQGKRLFRFLVNEDGITYDNYNVLMPFAFPGFDGSNNGVRGEMEIVKTEFGHRLATTYKAQAVESISQNEVITGADNGPYTFSVTVNTNGFCDNVIDFSITVNGVQDLSGNTLAIACGGTTGLLPIGGCAAVPGSDPCDIAVAISTAAGAFADFVNWEIRDANNNVVVRGGPYGLRSNDAHIIWITDIDQFGNASFFPGENHVLQLDYDFNSAQPYVHGLEFSQDASVLYVTHNSTLNHPEPIEFYDLNNPTAGLQPLNVLNEIEFQSSQIATGSDGRIYFATDNRLAALENPNNPDVTNWNDQAVTGISYNSNALGLPAPLNGHVCHILPKSIPGVDYTELPLTYDLDVYTADETAVWEPANNPFNSSGSSLVRIMGELVIPSGVHITIENMRFEFYTNARVIVEPGARLTMDNSVFTTGPCHDEMWLGVEVRGDGNLPQLPTSNQGYLRMVNNSRIENAYIAVVAGYRETNETPDGEPVILPSESSLYSGGIIRAYNSRFRNNQRDVLIWNTTLNPPSPFADNNLSYFDNCDFIVDQKLKKENVNPIVRVQLTALHDRGVTFRNCSFRNTAPFDDIIVPLRGGGIRAIDSELSVIGLNESFEPGNHDGLPATENVHQTFYRLRYGVWISGVSGMMPVVRGMEFQENHRGLFVQDKRRGIYTFNNFYIPANDDNYPGQPWGAYFQSTSGFIVEENAFIGADNSSNCMGLCVQNQNIYPSNDDIYRNAFENLRIGFQVKGMNSNGLTIGLQARCNQFNDNAVADIVLTPNSYWRPEQGVLSGPEGLTNNVFSLDVYNCAIPYEDVSVPQFYGGPGPFTYYCFPENVTRPNCPQPNMIVDDNSAVVQGVSFSYEDHCPSRYTQGGTVKKHNFSALAADYEQGIADLQSAKHLLAVTIDGGETEDVLDILQNIHMEESSFLRDLLMARYPLSREVLMAAIEAASSFDPWHLTQVLVANSRLPHDVYTFLNTHDVLTPFFMQFVHDAQANNGANIGRLLMAEVSARTHEKADHLRDIFRYFYEYNDSLNTQEWEDFVESQSDDTHRWMQFDLQLSDQNYNGALNLLDSIESVSTGLKDWINFSFQTTSADSIMQSDIDYAWQFMHEDSMLIGSAWSWLNKYGHTDSLPLFDETVYPKSFFVENNSEAIKPERFLQAWPNPAKDSVVLTYPREANGMGMVQLFNADGRLVHEFNASDAGFQEINVTGWSPGLYIAKLIVNGKDFETVKISVVR